ncbi:hypothetical protein [Burkholderia ambifaria]|uniref:hypothetical protein n=1 Tax=Burkholderia ambifaria TaxID=152480 RepID=UPI00158DD957|nr:hypothetical protein [Burkholderia ambifaria]
MSIESIYSFLTYPKNHKRAADAIDGIHIKPDKGKLSKMLSEVFDSATSRRDVPVTFVSDNQINPIREQLLAFFTKPRLASALPLAQSLQAATPGTAGMGLFFVCLGTDEGKAGKRIVLSRFAADEGVVASKNGSALSVEFVEQVFLKNAHTYKAATYRHEAGKSDAWKGIATDRQLNHGSKAIADYWIVDFLCSELTTTAAEGTRRLAIAMKDASRSTSDPQVRGEIVAAARLAGNLTSNAMTIEQFCDQFAMSQRAKDAVKAAVKPARLITESFRFDADEFIRHVPYKQIELDNGATLSAPTDRFEDVFHSEKIGDAHAYSTQGMIVDEKLRSSR